MRITNFDIYQNLLKEKSGLIVTPDKSYLLDSRLNPIAKKWGYESLDAMTTVLQGVPEQELVDDVVEAMTNNETSFFRDSSAFNIMKNDILPEVIKKRAAKKSLRIWCAASSSGQEPYSLAMLLKDTELPKLKMSIKATDISNKILKQARKGTYSQFEVQRGLEITTLMKHFTQENDQWQINKDIRDMVQFEYFNLLDSMSGLGKFDIILCRNVLIYFDEETKKQVLEKIATQLAPDGFLLLDGAEDLLEAPNALTPMPDKKGLYIKVDNAGAQKSASQALA